MIRRLSTTMVVVSALGIAGSAWAQPPRNPPPGRPAAQPAGGPSSAAASKFLTIPGLFPLSLTGVQREIALTAGQKQQLKAVSDGYLAAMQQLGGNFDRLEPEEKQKQGKDFNTQAAQTARDAQRKAETILSPLQLQAVQKIAFELSATRSLADPKVQEKIGLSAEQRQHLSQIFEQAGEKMQQLQRDTAQQTMRVLDEGQAATLKEQLESQKKPQ
jgi:hypothetical protein